jgi:hypothetical protein
VLISVTKLSRGRKRKVYEDSDLQALSLSLENQKPNSRPTPSLEVFALERASKIAARYREMGIKRASVAPDLEDGPGIALFLDNAFAQQLLNIYSLYVAGSLVPVKKKEVIHEDDDGEYT